MTIDRLLLKDLIEKGSDGDLPREMMTYVANRMMDLDVEALTGAAYNERSADRSNQRNGYRERDWHTRAGTIPVAIPKLRKGSYFPSFLEPGRTSEKALAAVIQEAYVQGVSPRSVDELVKAMGMTGICSGIAWEPDWHYLMSAHFNKLRAAIREEEKARREQVLAWVPAITGIGGIAVAILTLLKR